MCENLSVSSKRFPRTFTGGIRSSSLPAQVQAKPHDADKYNGLTVMLFEDDSSETLTVEQKY